MVYVVIQMVQNLQQKYCNSEKKKLKELHSTQLPCKIFLLRLLLLQLLRQQPGAKFFYYVFFTIRIITILLQNTFTTSFLSFLFVLVNWMDSKWMPNFGCRTTYRCQTFLHIDVGLHIKIVSSSDILSQRPGIPC